MSDADILAVKEAMGEFIEAFDNLEWERFTQCFSADATVFLPFDVKLRRADGKEEVEAGFKRIFDAARTRTSGPPYLHLTPQDVTIRILQDLALVTFHLESIHRIGRRTILLQRQENQWKIVHLHASNMELQRT